MMGQSLRDLASGLANQVTRAKLVLSGYHKSGKRTMLQVTGMAGEVFSEVELLLPYGMSALPVGKTADVLIFQVNASRDHKVGFAADDPALRIPDLKAGELGLRDASGQQIVLRGDKVEITTSKKLAISVEGDATITVNGALNITAPSGDIVVAGISLVHHLHNGVTAGGDLTSQPVP